MTKSQMLSEMNRVAGINTKLEYELAEVKGELVRHKALNLTYEGLMRKYLTIIENLSQKGV